MSAATPKSRADAFALQNNIRHQSEDQMADLAGNAMTSTIVGTCVPNVPPTTPRLTSGCSGRWYQRTATADWKTETKPQQPEAPEHKRKK